MRRRMTGVHSTLLSLSLSLLVCGVYCCSPTAALATFQDCTNNNGTTCGADSSGVCDSNGGKGCNSTDSTCICYQKKDSCPCGKDA
jgi:hypothetical protein